MHFLLLFSPIRKKHEKKIKVQIVQKNLKIQLTFIRRPVFYYRRFEKLSKCEHILAILIFMKTNVLINWKWENVDIQNLYLLGNVHFMYCIIYVFQKVKINI